MFRDCVCFVFKKPLSNFPMELLNCRLSSGLLFGTFPQDVHLLDGNASTSADIISILDDQRTARRRSAPSYIPDKLIPASALFVLVNTVDSLLKFLENLKQKDVLIYILVSLCASDKKKWQKQEVTRMNCSNVFGKKIILPAMDIGEHSEDTEIYHVSLLAKSGYTRCDSTTTSGDLVANAMTVGTLGTSSINAFIFKDLAFKIGAAEKFGS